MSFPCCRVEIEDNSGILKFVDVDFVLAEKNKEKGEYHEAD
jgi:hypothetical protein